MIYSHEVVFVQADAGPTLSGNWKKPAAVADGPAQVEQDADDLSNETSAPCIFLETRLSQSHDYI